jgi:hypothetical protein
MIAVHRRDLPRATSRRLAVITVNGSYQPQWMRLGEAASYLERSRSMGLQDAKDWLLRAMQDVLRGDRIRYPQQNMFRVQGYPMRWINVVRPIGQCSLRRPK